MSRWGSVTWTTDDGLVEAIQALGRRALPLQMDITRRAEIDRARSPKRTATSGASTFWSTTPASARPTPPSQSPKKISTKPWRSTSRGRSS